MPIANEFVKGVEEKKNQGAHPKIRPLASSYLSQGGRREDNERVLEPYWYSG